MKIWNDDEVKSLFQNVEKFKQEKKSLILAFAEHANRFSRKPNSVRNYYYHEVDNLESDKTRAAKLRIDLTKHQKAHFKNFDKVQEGDLFGEIDRLTSGGLSVRAACLKLSGGDLALMTRFQNKYQNMKRKLEKNENSKNVAQKQHKSAKNGVKKPVLHKFVSLKDEDDEKIIPFKIPRMLSDADINSLFLGLVRLVKKSAQDEVEEKSRQIQSAFKEKDAEFETLKQKFQALKEENALLASQLQKISHQSKKLALEKHFDEKISQSKKEEKNQAKRG